VSRWFINYRQQWIAQHLATQKRINRQNLMLMFDISMPQASQDIQLYIQNHPGAVVYDYSAKTYRAATHQP